MELERRNFQQSPSEGVIFFQPCSAVFQGQKSDCRAEHWLGIRECVSGRDRSSRDGLWNFPRIDIRKQGKIGVAPGFIV